MMVSYPALKGGASRIIAPPCLLSSPKEGRGGRGRSSTGTPGGTHPARLKRTREALRSRSRVKPQCGQRKTRSSKVKPRLIPPHQKHSREELYAGTASTALPCFWNCHSSIRLSSENAESWSRSLLFLVSPFWIRSTTFKSSRTKMSYSVASRAPSLNKRSRLKSFTYSCSFASFSFALNQFLESFFFLERLLCSNRVLSRERSSGLGLSRKRPSERVASLVIPTSKPTAFFGSPADACSYAASSPSTRNTTYMRPEGLSLMHTWHTRSKGKSLCIITVKKPTLLR